MCYKSRRVHGRCRQRPTTAGSVCTKREPGVSNSARRGRAAAEGFFIGSEWAETKRPRSYDTVREGGGEGGIWVTNKKTNYYTTSRHHHRGDNHLIMKRPLCK
ncbi:hypothetical protein NDU88_005167 [Pleurodeles waltl]|uniref:Uncharacterized protein n=1 Tax=Pleurodeles waltl TaxID=8319 RepID=A0AAV7KZX7_PLEWA|nr:hypothetical protein NDU88_005167 [Pleurodeles waltl]